MKKSIPTNITEIQEEVSVYVTEVLRAFAQRGMSMGDEEMLDFPRLLWSMHYEEFCYDMLTGTRRQKLDEDFGHYELLGEYAPTGYQITDCPTVILYQPALHYSAEFLLFYLHRIERGMESFDAMFSMLLERIIVLVYTHEMMHWLIHQIRSTAGESLGELKYGNIDEIAFHEAMVQSCMAYTFRDKPLMISMMGALENGQPMQYKLYKELGSNFDMVFDAFQFLQADRIQSFEILKRAVDFNIAETRRERESAFWVDLLKQPENEVFAEHAFPCIRQMLNIRFPDLAHTYRGFVGARRVGII